MRGKGKHIFSRIGLSRFLQWRANTYLVRFLPLVLSRAYLYFLGYLYYLFNNEEKRTIEYAIRTILREKYHLPEIKKITSLALKGIFTHYHEKLLMAYADHKRLHSLIFQSIRLKNQELLDAALRKGRGVILVTGHFGAVEFMPAILALHKYPLTMIVRFKTKRLRKVLLERSKYYGVRLLDAGRENISFTALSTLKRNEILITECDEFKDWKPYKNKATALFGVTSPVDRTLDALQRKYQSPVIFALLRRGWNGTYVLEFNQITENQETRPRAPIAERVLSILENYVYTYPEQWYQWKTAGLFLGPQLEVAMEQSDEARGTGYLSSPDPVFAHSQT